jgi:hypothetical protein
METELYANSSVFVMLLSSPEIFQKRVECATYLLGFHRFEPVAPAFGVQVSGLEQ